jgi:hypothetical protein
MKHRELVPPPDADVHVTLEADDIEALPVVEPLLFAVA